MDEKYEKMQKNGGNFSDMSAKGILKDQENYIQAKVLDGELKLS